jgi:DNA-binding GntR family transcriptional regulator
MRESSDRIPDEVLKEIFPEKLNRSQISETVYTELKEMILSGRLKKGQRVVRYEIARNFNVHEYAVARAFSQLRKDGLISSNGRGGSSVMDGHGHKGIKRLE